MDYTLYEALTSFFIQNKSPKIVIKYNVGYSIVKLFICSSAYCSIVYKTSKPLQYFTPQFIVMELITSIKSCIKIKQQSVF